MKRTDLAYIAGLFDGEGCVSFTRQSKHKFPEDTDIPTTYYLRCQLGITNRWLVEWLKFAFGGFVYQRKHKNPDYKTLYTWTVSCNKAGEFLKVLMPYLKLKKAQAELALKVQSQCEANNRRRLTDEERAVRDAEYILMKKLKKGED